MQKIRNIQKTVKKERLIRTVSNINFNRKKLQTEKTEIKNLENRHVKKNNCMDVGYHPELVHLPYIAIATNTRAN